MPAVSGDDPTKCAAAVSLQKPKAPPSGRAGLVTCLGTGCGRVFKSEDVRLFRFCRRCKRSPEWKDGDARYPAAGSVAPSGR